MILFQDSDSICKRYLLDEEGVTVTQDLVTRADLLAASLVSYAEVRGVLARARRGRRIRSNRDYSRIVTEFDSDWDAYYRIPVTTALAQRAGGLAANHGLTGLDAIQLASALTLQDLILETIMVSAWDQKSGLVSAILAEGLSLAHEVNS